MSARHPDVGGREPHRDRRDRDGTVRSTGGCGRRVRSAHMVALALWLLAVGCGGENQGKVPSDEGAPSARSSADAVGTSRKTDTSIAFESDRDGDFEVYVMDADGTDQT